MTRDGSLYRVDLRLRPFGSKGMSAMSIDAFLGYMTETAAVWEMLAFVKLRMVGGDASIGLNVENETRRIIHERAAALPANELREETLRVRLALENQRVRTRRGGDIDIKYGAGGMLHVYFAMRFLQLRDDVPDATIDAIFADLHSIRAVLPGVLDITSGRSESPEQIERGYLHGFVADFTDWDALAAYQAHPDHRRVGDALIANAVGGLDGILVFDLAVKE